MLYLNKGFQVKEKELKFGKLKCFELGDAGRGRRNFLLPVPNSMELNAIFEEGMHKNLTIGLSKSGKPRVNWCKPSENQDYIYLIIDSYAGYTRRGSGYVKLMKSDGCEKLVEANGADGDAGRIGSWDVTLIKVPNDGKRRVIKCDYSGGGYRNKDREYALFICSKNKVDLVWNGELEDYFDMINEEMNPLLKDPYALFKDRRVDMNRGKELLNLINKFKKTTIEELLDKYDNIIIKDNKPVCETNDIIVTGRYLFEDKSYYIIDTETREKVEEIDDELNRFSLERISKNLDIYAVNEKYLNEIKNYINYNIENDLL